ncbi:MAG: MASE1 domain-containing protein [Candidatus Micrarchaeota archaeon]|nr:MASE1 domain-containing protein [Candidatus Micrarchaeota archaeon]
MVKKPQKKRDSDLFFRIGIIVGVLLVYLVAGKVGLSLALINSSVTAIWPPTGIALAALLIFGFRYWPVIYAGAFIVNFSTTGDIMSSVFIALGNTLEAYVAAFLVKRFANGISAFDTWQNTVKFGLSAVPAAVVAATVGVTTLLLSGLTTYVAYALTWVTWFLGDFTGAVIFAPAIILLYRNPYFNYGEKPGEKLTFILLVIVLPALIFNTSIVAYHPGAYLCLVLIGIIGMKYTPRETALAGIAIAMTAIFFTAHGVGPFIISGGQANTALLLLQLFVAILTLFGLVLAALTKSEDNLRRQLLAERNSLDLQVRYMEAEMGQDKKHHGVILEPTKTGFLDLDLENHTSIRNAKHDQVYGHYSMLPSWNMDIFYEHVLPQDRKVAHKAYAEAYKTGKLSLECRIKWPDNSIHWIEIRGLVSFDEDHKPLRILSRVIELARTPSR